MRIRLTSAEGLDRVLESLKQGALYNEEVNAMFLKYAVPTIKEGLAKGDDEWYLEIDWRFDQRVGSMVSIFRYSRRSEMPTDEEYLTEKDE